MPHPERPFDPRPQVPMELSPELATFLRGKDYACVTEAINHGTALIIKVPTPEIMRVGGVVPIHLRQTLYAHPTAPVIQLVVTIVDQPHHPLVMETFINVDDPHQHDLYQTLTTQTMLPLLFYDEALVHQRTKVVPLTQQQDTAAILAAAQRYRAAIPPDRFNFDLAKAAVLQTTRL